MPESNTTTTHSFTDESPIDGLCDICGSSAQFHIGVGLGWRCGKWVEGYAVWDRYNNLIASGIKTEETAKAIVDYANNYASLVAALGQIVSGRRADGRYDKYDAAGFVAIAERALRLAGSERKAGVR